MTNGLSLEELMKEETYPEEYAEGENWRILLKNKYNYQCDRVIINQLHGWKLEK